MHNDSIGYYFVYYCSGHGYGHATRVSAFACHLLRLQPRPVVHIVSSAPKHVFSDSIALGALYRYADIDPVIVQPLAYRVDRRKSIEVLRSFLLKKDHKVSDESQWLKSIGADCVLSDAAFLGCLSAHEAGIPSVLITNFSFDSVYSYLSTSLIDAVTTPPPVESDSLQMQIAKLPPDVPIPLDELSPLVGQIVQGFRCADLLLRLPGAIPMPSFSIEPSLPSADWVDPAFQVFKPDVVAHLTAPPSTHTLHPQIPFSNKLGPKPVGREMRSAPLIVRSPNPSVYTRDGRSHLLGSLGVPSHLHDSGATKILIVSFGGQVFHKPQSRIHSRSPSAASTPGPFTAAATRSLNGKLRDVPYAKPSDMSKGYFPDPSTLSVALRSISLTGHEHRVYPSPGLMPPAALRRGRAKSVLQIPGAPPSTIPTSPPSKKTMSPPMIDAPKFEFTTMPPSPDPKTIIREREDNGPTSQFEWAVEDDEGLEEPEPRLLPDDTWIAIVCGVSKEWGTENGEELPENFFVAPRDVYMPDLTAVADVLLGKLGYGTVSECVDACTPFVYVPRPLFIEEHGLRQLLATEGVGVELSRISYEMGEWADAVEEAWLKGRHAKEKKRKEGETGKRHEEGRQMANELVRWLEHWRLAISS